MECIHILLVDDEPVVRLGLRMRLGAEADMAVVGEAQDGIEALREVEILQPDIVVIDFQMPGLNGLETVREAIARGYRSSFVMLSASGQSSLETAALAAGAAAFVSKHERDGVLLDAIRNAAGRLVLEHPP